MPGDPQSFPVGDATTTPLQQLQYSSSTTTTEVTSVPVNNVITYAFNNNSLVNLFRQ